MKKQVKRVIVAFLALILLSSCFVGCSSDKSYDYADVLASYREMLIKVRDGVVMLPPKDDKDEMAVLLDQIGQISVPEKMGYAIKDINGDGIDELVLMSESYEPYALFTAKKGKAVLLWSWVENYELTSGAIDHYGYIYGYESWDGNTEGWCCKVMCIGKDGELSSLDYGRKILNADTDPVQDKFFVTVCGKEYEIGKMDAVQNIANDKFGEFGWNHTGMTYEAGFYYVSALLGEHVSNDGAYAVDFSSYDAVLATYRKIVPYMVTGVDQLMMENFSFSDHVEYETFLSVASAARSAIAGMKIYDFDTGESAYPEDVLLAYGYALKDINGDGTDELLLMLDDYTVFALFTLRGGKPVLLLDGEMTVGADGQIRMGRGHVDRYYSDYYIYEIDGNGSLQTKLHFGYLFAESMYGYRIENDTFVPVSTLDEVWELYLEHFVRVYPNTRPNIKPTTTTAQGKEFTKSVNGMTFIRLDGMVAPKADTVYYNFTVNPTGDQEVFADNKLSVKAVTADSVEISWDIFDGRSAEFISHLLSGTARVDGDSYLLESDGWRLRLEFAVGNVWAVVEQSPVDGMASSSYLFRQSATLEPIE